MALERCILLLFCSLDVCSPDLVVVIPLILFDFYFNEGYGNRSIVAMSKCYGSYSPKYDRFGKFIDTKQTCSFHYLHDGCNKPKKVAKSYTPYNLTHLAKSHIGASSSK